MGNKVVRIKLDGNIDPYSAYEQARDDGYSGSEEKYTKDMALLGRELTQSQFDAIPNRISKLTKTVESADGFINVSDSAPYDILDMGLDGKTEQKQYSGKNLLDTSSILTKWNCILLDENTIKFQSNINDNYFCSISFNDNELCTKILDSKGSYLHFSVKDNHNKYISIVLYADDTVYEVDGRNNHVKLQILDSLTKITSLELRFNRNGAEKHTDTSTVFKELMFYIGDENTTLEFEPYVGGIPSPNPQYSQEIVNAGSMNLFDIDSILAEYDNKNYTVIEGYHVVSIRLKPTTKYYIKVNGVRSSAFYCLLSAKEQVDADSTQTVGISNTWDSECAVTTDETGKLYFGCTVILSNLRDILQEALVQIEEGSTPTPYKPFGKYNIECNVANKNLFDETKLSRGEFIEFNGVRCYKYLDGPGHFLYGGIYKENTQYSITVRIFRDDDELSKDKETSIIVFYTDGTLHHITARPNVLYTYTSERGKSISEISGDYNWTRITYLDLSVMQIEEGAEATDYTEPKPQRITLTSERPITKWDKLVKKDGVWGWSYKHLHLQLNDVNADWFVYDSFKGFYALHYLPENMNRRDGYCNQQRVDNIGRDMINGIWLGVNVSKETYSIRNSFYDDTAEDKGLANWKSHLSENPLDIWTYSDTEEFVPLSDEEQTLLNNLETYYGVTNVYNDQGCPMWLTYVQDTKLAIENKIKQLKSQ